MRKPPTVKSTIRNDPFAAVIPDPTALDLPAEASQKPEPPPVVLPSAPRPRPVNADDRQESRMTPAPRGKQKLTVHLSAELADRVKNAAYWNPKLTIAGIAEQGIKAAVEKVERENGGKYPPREGELVGGRPIK